MATPHEQRVPSHIVTNVGLRGSHLMARMFTQAGSKSIRRNSDVSPIAVLVDHENSIHTRPYAGDHEFGAFGSHGNHVLVTRPQVLMIHN